MENCDTERMSQAQQQTFTNSHQRDGQVETEIRRSRDCENQRERTRYNLGSVHLGLKMGEKQKVSMYSTKKLVKKP